MRIKVNNSTLSVPPYISTSWKYVEAIYMKGATLVVNLVGKDSVNIPGVATEFLDMIFTAHSEYLDQLAASRSFPPLDDFLPPFPGLPFDMQGSENGFSFGISSLGGINAMQHNPAHANAPDLPTEVLQKIGAIVKIVAPEELSSTSTIAEQDCNCPYCQITRAITGDTVMGNEMLAELEAWGASQEALETKEVVAPWIIQETGEKQFLVIRAEDQAEFRVFLGDPLGCTCGQQGCEHILAVLRN